jgi:GDPmannose 4,6-dehydratase
MTAMGQTALITGITGQDGSYLAELLLERGYRVIGTVRPHAAVKYERIGQIRGSIELAEVDLLDAAALQELVERHRPAEIYNLAARASSSQLFSDPVLTGEYNALTVARLLEAICKTDTRIRFCQASSSEMFGKSRESPQSEATPFYPRNPYGIAKLAGHWFVVNYRETHNIFACSSILFNHESPRRGREFVTRRITTAVARIQAGLQSELGLGDLEARRDWGYAADYVRGMWQMLQAPAAGDYVLATGETHSVREFCEIAFSRAGLDYRNHVVVDPAYRRDPEAVQLVGDATKAARDLGWQPTVSFRELVHMMVDADMKALNEGKSGQ